MKHRTFFTYIRRASILLAAIGLMGAFQIASAQKSTKTSPTGTIKSGISGGGLSFAPSGIVSDSDFTGDNMNDIVFLDSPSSKWIINDSNGSVWSIQMGAADSQPVAADFDGDGIIDIASVNTQDGVLTWQILQSSNAVETQVVWGLEGDTLVKGDYDGDGKADTAVRRPSDGFWYINGSTAGSMVIECGFGTDVAVPGDYDGDGSTDAAVFRASERTLFFFGSFDQTMHSFVWDGLLTNRSETFVPADYDGDGTTDFAIFNARAGVWTILESSTGEYHVEVFAVGPAACGNDTLNTCGPDFAFPGDYDNDGKADPAVWNPTVSKVRVIGSSSGSMTFPVESNDSLLPVSAFFMTK